MTSTLSTRMQTVPRSFIREILKVTQDPTVISFAGGLPNPRLFPTESLAEAAKAAIAETGASSLQYSTTEGHEGLRQWIADRYKQKAGMTIDPEHVLITTGSQQALDLAGKVFINPGDTVVMETPGYLGAIQAFCMFEPHYVGVPLEEDGPNLEALEKALDSGARLFYAVTTFQNPSGLTYSEEKRKAVAEILKGRDVIFMEDNPYGELRYAGKDIAPLYSHRPENSMLMGTFSKIAAPGFRIGWVVAEPEIRHALVTAKQAADLHTSTVDQAILHRWLTDNDLDAHVATISKCYGQQSKVMLEAADKYFPDCVTITRPEGGMFLWVTMPEGTDSHELFDLASKEKVAFVPGTPFYVDGGGYTTMRLNYSNAEEATIEEGMRRLGKCMGDYLASHGLMKATQAA